MCIYIKYMNMHRKDQEKIIQNIVPIYIGNGKIK